ncbi:hypothetical protein PMZ80_005238 [Knufia obscura]|uniref:Uncharacterized protein n=1 Tax=Knufia obscura TaxID=1635080 RepID=A0ABR0RQ43_9EURO|nr:hypothetical protein PMZ80_005238 [Knufia obscura]
MGKIDWTSADYRSLLDYVQSISSDSDKPDTQGLTEHLKQHMQDGKARVLDRNIVSERLGRIVSKTKKDRTHYASDLWKQGPKILDLRHAFLEGIYTEEEIVHIESGTRQLGRKRKAGEELSTEKSPKRQKTTQENNEEVNTSGDIEVSVDTAPQRKRRRDPDEEWEPEPRTKKAKSSTDVPAQKSIQPATEAELESQPVTVDLEAETEPANGPGSGRDTITRLKVPGLRQERADSPHGNVPSASVIPTEHVDRSGSSSTTQPPQGTDARSTEQEQHENSGMAEAESEQPPEIEETLYDSPAAPMPTTRPLPQDCLYASAIPGLSDRDTAKKLGEIYTDISTAIHLRLEELGLDPNQSAQIHDREWNQHLQPLMHLVFGHMSMPETLAKDYADIQTRRPLPLSVLLRSLVAAAVMQWAMKPHPMRTVSSSVSYDARMLDCTKHVIDRNFGVDVLTQMLHEATKRAVKTGCLPEIDARSAILTNRLILALSSFLEPSQRGQYLHVDEVFHFLPLSQYQRAATAKRAPTTKRVDESEDSVLNPLPGITLFEENLQAIFRKALKLRCDWEMQHDGKYIFEFPPMRTPFDVEKYFCEEVPPKTAASNANEPPSANVTERTFVCTMFSVLAEVRKEYNQGYGELQRYTRAAVFKLDPTTSAS